MEETSSQKACFPGETAEISVKAGTKAVEVTISISKKQGKLYLEAQEAIELGKILEREGHEVLVKTEEAG